MPYAVGLKVSCNAIFIASTGVGPVSANDCEAEDAAAEADDGAAEEAADDAAGAAAAWGPDGPDGPAGTACGLEAAWATTCWA